MRAPVVCDVWTYWLTSTALGLFHRAVHAPWCSQVNGCRSHRVWTYWKTEKSSLFYFHTRQYRQVEHRIAFKKWHSAPRTLLLSDKLCHKSTSQWQAAILAHNQGPVLIMVDTNQTVGGRLRSMSAWRMVDCIPGNPISFNFARMTATLLIY